MRVSNAPSEASLIARKEAHRGPVRGLQANPFQANLVASGATDAEVLLWDLNNTAKTFTPGAAKSQKIEDVTDLAWNCKVGHILATASNNGYVVMWDLKNRKEVIQLACPAGRRSISSIAWNPDVPTHLLTACDDDANPVIYSWDLRNAHAPRKGKPAQPAYTQLDLDWAHKGRPFDRLVSQGRRAAAQRRQGQPHAVLEPVVGNHDQRADSQLQLDL